MMIDPRTDVLIVVDLQNDFMPGGPLAVPAGDAVVAPCNLLVARFDHVILTQDWHPLGHVSFASTHPAKKPFDAVKLPDGRRQILWPDHCVQGSKGAEIVASLEAPHAELIIRKGYRRDLDSYSAFVEADGQTQTGLAGYLRERNLRRVVVCGLATDFCAGWSAIDAARAGFETILVADATRGIDIDESMARAFTDMSAAGVIRVEMADIPA